MRLLILFIGLVGNVILAAVINKEIMVIIGPPPPHTTSTSNDFVVETIGFGSQDGSDKVEALQNPLVFGLPIPANEAVNTVWVTTIGTYRVRVVLYTLFSNLTTGTEEALSKTHLYNVEAKNGFVRVVTSWWGPRWSIDMTFGKTQLVSPLRYDFSFFSLGFGSE